MKTIILSNREADMLCKLKSGDSFYLIRPLSKQPPEDYFGSFDSSWRPSLRYKVGTRLGVRETWAWNPLLFGYSYKADMPIDVNPECGSALDWHSSATMPKEAIRKHIVVVENMVKRVGQITFGEASIISGSSIIGNTVIHSDFINYWNSLYAKPRKWKDGYVVYTYQNSSSIVWINRHKNNKHLTCITKDGNAQLYWDGKPLTIHANPYLEHLKVRAE